MTCSVPRSDVPRTSRLSTSALTTSSRFSPSILDHRPTKGGRAICACSARSCCVAFRTEVRLRARSICRASVARFSWRRVRTSRGTTPYHTGSRESFRLGRSIGRGSQSLPRSWADARRRSRRQRSSQRSNGANGGRTEKRMWFDSAGGRDAGRGRRPSGEGRDGRKWPTPPPTCARRAPRHSTALRAVTPAGLRLLRFVFYVGSAVKVPLSRPKEFRQSSTTLERGCRRAGRPLPVAARAGGARITQSRGRTIGPPCVHPRSLRGPGMP